MKITFLGTAAAQGIPMPYCDCTTCTNARKFHGQNIRKRCSYFVNDNLLVDMGPDLFAACAIHDVDLINMNYTLITHSHLDHIFVQNLGMRAKGMHQQTNLPQLKLVAPPSVMTLLNAYGSSDKDMKLQRYPVLPFDCLNFPDYLIKSIKAKHIPNVGDAVNYFIDDGNRKVLFASDTAIYEDRVWPYLANHKIDLLIIECTKGLKQDSSNVHLNIIDLQFMIEKMLTIHAITENTIIYATHFSHQNCPPHEELSEILKKIGVNCA
ncbi:MBL fold metallo-hydrolase [Virgibacillus ndiopensis]|uniref:MBL fold metallo-hydrolase n=1 Tax=Virgibacillus ndiopensis TaxID=2004408 RepID=UPI00159B9FE7|nr:MBL fold metallo-hydrolase [Virgibacillus ndiopensis]